MAQQLITQFSQFEEFIQEDLHHGNMVRVVALDITECISTQIPGLHMAGVGVHIRP